MLRPTLNAKELILAMGGFGSGKTYQALLIAHWLRKTGSPAKMFYVNTDKPLDMYAATWEGMYENVIPFEVAEWPEYMDALRKVQADLDPERGDWYTIDLADSVWEQAKATFVEVSYETTQGQFMLKAAAHEQRVRDRAEELGIIDPKKLKEYLKAQGVGGPAIGGSHGKDWDVIKKVYRDFMLPIYRLRANVLALTPETEWNAQRAEGVDLELRSAYEKLGVMPKGEKTLGHMFHTTLRLQRATLDSWRANTIRETSGPSRTRKYLVNESIDAEGGLVTKYLMKVAGWRDN